MKYKVDDLVILTTNAKLLESIGLYNMSGKIVKIELVSTFYYIYPNGHFAYAINDSVIASNSNEIINSKLF